MKDSTEIIPRESESSIPTAARIIHRLGGRKNGPEDGAVELAPGGVRDARARGGTRTIRRFGCSDYPSERRLEASDLDLKSATREGVAILREDALHLRVVLVDDPAQRVDRDLEAIVEVEHIRGS